MTLVRPGESPAADPQKLDDLLESIRKRYGLPGIAAVIADKNQVVADGVCGLRKMGEPGLIPPTAHWQLGSVTKTFYRDTCGDPRPAGQAELDHDA